MTGSKTSFEDKKLDRVLKLSRFWTWAGVMGLVNGEESLVLMSVFSRKVIKIRRRATVEDFFFFPNGRSFTFLSEYEKYD